MNIYLALLGAAAIIAIAAASWQRSILVIFFLVVFEGVLRKWIIPQASELIYFLKDLILIGAYLRYFFLNKERAKLLINSDFLQILLFLVITWCVFQAFNPSLGSPIVGLFGLKGYLLYIPLMWMLPHLFQSEEELYKFLRNHLLLLIPVCLLGVAQFASPPSSPINVYAGGEEATAAFAGIEKPRITGTFSYISGLAVYLTVCFSLLLPVLLKKQPPLWQWLSIIELALLIANSFMTGSRSVIFFQILFLLIYVILLFLKQPSILKSYLQQFSAPVILTIVAINTWFRSALDAFIMRATTSDSAVDRVADGFVITQYFQYKQWDGYGTGATHQAVQALRNVIGLPQGEIIPVGFESEMGRIVLELGPLGFAFWYGLRVNLIIALWFTFLKLKRPFLRQLALAAFIIHFIQLSGQLVVNHIFLVYYWFLSSFIFLLPYLEIKEDWAQQQKLFQDNGFSSYITDSSNR